MLLLALARGVLVGINDGDKRGERARGVVVKDGDKKGDVEDGSPSKALATPTPASPKGALRQVMLDLPTAAWYDKVLFFLAVSLLAPNPRPLLMPTAPSSRSSTR